MVKEQEVRSPYEGLIIPGIILFLVVSAIFSSCYIIQAGERGVLLTFGKANPNSIGEGLGFKIPFVQNIVIMDIKTQKYEAELTAASRDLQDVNTKIAINYRLIGEKVPEVYTEIGTAYRENVIYPLEQETNKAVTSQYTAEQLITNREEVKDKMKNALADKLRDKGIIVEDISIIDFKFSASFTSAIEGKVSAEQNALTAKNKLSQTEYEVQAMKLQNQQLTPEYLKFKELELQSKALDKWDGKLPQVTGGAIPFISLTTGTNSSL